MQTTIATLDVVISDGIGDPLADFPSGMLPPRGERTHYTVTLRPKVDGQILQSIKEPRNLESVETLLAHELGHFVATIFSDPSHNPNLKILSVLIGDSTLNVPAEKKAWELGEIINPRLNQSIKQKALEGYSSNGSSGAGRSIYR
jgi:hypothetical protein